MFDKIHLNCYVHKRSIMNSINKKEIEKFSRIAEEWWNPDGKFKPLHNFNPVRIKYIKDNIVKDFNIKTSSKPFKGIKVLDIGYWMWWRVTIRAYVQTWSKCCWNRCIKKKY